MSIFNVQKPVLTSLLYHIEFKEESQSNNFYRFLWAEMQYRCFSPEANVKGLYSIYSLQIENVGAAFYLNCSTFLLIQAGCYLPFPFFPSFFSLSVAGSILPMFASEWSSLSNPTNTYGLL